MWILGLKGLISAWRFVPNTEVVSGEHIRHFLRCIVFFFLHGAQFRRDLRDNFGLSKSRKASSQITSKTL